MSNPIFERAIASTIQSKRKRGRVDLLSTDIAAEVNTYKNFGVFKSYNDVYVRPIDSDDHSTDGKVNTKPGTPGVRSIFNKYAAVLTGNSNGNWENDSISDSVKKLVHKASEYRLSNNVPLMDTPENRKILKRMSGCTVRDLVKLSTQGYFGRAVYSYADFMYCKYLNKVSNNYLITLRRFPAPVTDGIFPTGRKYTRRSAGKADSFSPIGTMVTWLGVSGNDMKSILKYDYSMAFQEKSAGWEQIEKEGGDSGILNGMEAMFNKDARVRYARGEQVPALDNFMGKFFKVGTGGYRPLTGQEDKTKVYGPIDRVKKTYMRGSEGLDWNQKFDLVFEYELKAYNGINPRQAMLDLIASILSVTYTTGGFWGGGYVNAYGATQSSIFANLNIFKCQGGFTDFMDALSKDVSTGLSGLRKTISDYGNGLSGAIKALSAGLNALGGMLMGGLLNALGRPARYFKNSLLSDQPVGFWHITIGNPHHPIMTMGNMILKSTTIEHSGPLGLDDFPTQLKVTCSFDRGKPRDQRELEAIYMQGNGRIFNSMSGKVADMYKTATEYKKNPSTTPDKVVPKEDGSPNVEIAETSSADASDKVDVRKPVAVLDPNATAVESTMKSNADLQRTLNYYFGSADAYAIVSAAEEMAEGMARKSKVEIPEVPKDTTNNESQQDQTTQTE